MTAPYARRVERTRQWQARTPRAGFGDETHRSLDAAPALYFMLAHKAEGRAARRLSFPDATLLPSCPLGEQGMSASPALPKPSCNTLPCINLLIGSNAGITSMSWLRNKSNHELRVYSDEPPLNWTSHSRGNPARRASTTVFQLREVSKTSGSYPQLMRPRLANLLSPPRDISLNSALIRDGCYATVSNACVFA